MDVVVSVDVVGDEVAEEEEIEEVEEEVEADSVVVTEVDEVILVFSYS